MVLLLQLAIWLIDRGEDVPRSVPVIQWFVLVGLLAGPRLAARLALGPGRADGRRGGDAAAPRVPVLVVGMDHLAELFVRSTEHDPAATYRAVGVLDLASGERGRRLHHVPVFGGLAELPTAIAELARRELAPDAAGGHPAVRARDHARVAGGRRALPADDLPACRG